MTTIMAILVGFFHIILFALSLFFFSVFFKKENYKKAEALSFGVSFLSVGILGFFVANHFSFLSSDSSVLLAVGYTVVPITQVAICMLSYPVVKGFNFKYPPLFFGVMASAPLSFFLSTTLTQTYWEFLGRNIYG